MFLYLGLSDKDIPIEDRPFLAGFTFGFIKVDFVTNNGNKLPMDAAVVPIAFSIPGSPGELEVINVLFIKAYGVSDEVFIERLNLLKEKGALRLSLIDERNVINPIADQNQANFPNRVSDLQKFHETRDPRRIKGIIFEGSFLIGR